MAFLPRSDLLLLIFIFLLYWTTSSAWSQHLPQNNVNPNNRQGHLPSRTREKVKESLQTIKDSLTFTKDILGALDLLKSCSKFASLAPGAIGAVFSVINLVFALVPQDDPVRRELKDGFAEVNRKLDSLSIQISNLATDVEWFNYVSVYSQDEVRILNAWKKLSHFFDSSTFVQSEENKLRLAEIFTSYYENTAVEASVDNFYHYLTVSGTSLSGNINDLLMKRFKCDVTEISRYNLYFSSLLWKGMVLNQLYWRLIGLYSSVKEAEQTQMLKNVYNAQKSVVEFCLENYKLYMKEDVVEITKRLSPEDKQTIAAQVKKDLDKKYNWFSWVVLVFDTDKSDKYTTFQMTSIPVEKVTVSVRATVRVDKNDWKVENDKTNVIKYANECRKPTKCNEISKINQCNMYNKNNFHIIDKLIKVGEYAQVMFISCDTSHSSQPDSFYKFECDKSYWGACQAHMYYTHNTKSCPKCENNGICKFLPDSREGFCQCPDGYHGDECEKKMNTLSTVYTVPYIISTSIKLKMIESKLEELLSISRTCRG